MPMYLRVFPLSGPRSGPSNVGVAKGARVSLSGPAEGEGMPQRQGGGCGLAQLHQRGI